MIAIRVTNHGPLLLSSNYWKSELAAAGKLFVSVNAGAIRILLPPQLYGDLADMRSLPGRIRFRLRPIGFGVINGSGD